MWAWTQIRVFVDWHRFLCYVIYSNASQERKNDALDDNIADKEKVRYTEALVLFALSITGLFMRLCNLSMGRQTRKKRIRRANRAGTKGIAAIHNATVPGPMKATLSIQIGPIKSVSSSLLRTWTRYAWGFKFGSFLLSGWTPDINNELKGHRH